MQGGVCGGGVGGEVGAAVHCSARGDGGGGGARSAGSCREVQGVAGRCREVQGGAGRYRDFTRYRGYEPRTAANYASLGKPPGAGCDEQGT